MLTPARKIRLSEEVVGAIKDAIRRGAIQPGQRLVETDIAAQMRVSKAPVREALRQLQAEGLVENYPQRGSFVVGLSDQDMWEIATLRSELEGMALELAAQRIDAEGLQQMEDLLQEMVGAEDSGLRTERHLTPPPGALGAPLVELPCRARPSFADSHRRWARLGYNGSLPCF